MNEEQIKFMREAIRIALENVRSGKGGPFGAVVVKDGQVIAQGVNQVTHLNDPTAHAEVQAIRAACKTLGSFQLEGCELYASSEPCPMCLGAIYWARPDKVFFATHKGDAANIGFDDQFIYEEMSKNIDMRSIPMESFLREEALQIFQEWEAQEGKIEY